MAAETTRPAAPALLPWLERPLADALRSQQGHALLLDGPPGIGTFELAMALASAWLCEASPADAPVPACGHCAGCHLIAARSHPDLLVLVPEALADELGWGGEGAEGDEAPRTAKGGKAAKSGKAKPSKDIKVEAVRAANTFAQTTAARGRGKVVVAYPAERINAIAANALLKTLEEPPGNARFLLGATDAARLLPTVRSRCHAVAVQAPDAAAAASWLRGEGVAEPAVLLAAAGGQPLDALTWSREGMDGNSWRELPVRLARGDAQALAAWTVPRAVDALQKLCHDLMRRAAGAPPRYFPAQALAGTADLGSLAAWAAALRRHASQAEHPWNAPLMLDALALQARHALLANPAATRGQNSAGDEPAASLHSRR